jgi:S1-C subfamily serine protease
MVCFAVAACGGAASSPRVGSTGKLTRTTTTMSAADALATLVSTTQSGIVRIDTTTCDASEVGTGFLIGPRLVATVEHVVDGAVSITLKQNGKTVAVGTVIGEDPTRDVALVRTSSAIHGRVLHLAARAPRLGESVAALGFPFGLPLTVTQGAVSGLGRTIPIDGVERDSLVQTDAPINPGNSGGPLISLDTGEVVGLVDLGTSQANGIGFAVSALVAEPLLEAWTAAPQAVPAASCSATTTSPATTSPATTSPTTTTPSSSIATYSGSAFSIDYPAGWTVADAEQQHSWGTDTTIVSPTDANTLIRVDVSANTTDPNAKAAAQPEINQVSQETGYQQIALTTGTVDGFNAVYWEFRVDQGGVLLQKVDEFFIDSDNDDGVAVLTQAPAHEYPADADAFAAIRQTLAMN